MLKNVPELRKAVREGDAAFGTLDSWILYKISGGAIHATDVSHAACTGFYDPFVMEWSKSILNFFSIPKNILPTVLDSDSKFCVTHPSLFGAEIPVTCSVSFLKIIMTNRKLCLVSYSLQIKVPLCLDHVALMRVISNAL